MHILLPKILTILLFLSCIVTFELKAQQPQLEKLSEDAVEQENIDKALRLSEDILSSMAAGSYYEFAEGEAMPILEQQFTEDMQKQQYQVIKSQLGAYESGLEYHEAYQATQAGQQFTIYRLRGSFSKGKPEVRVVFTPDQQLAGLQVLPWQDQLQ